MFAPVQQFRQHYQIAEEIGRGAFAICYKAIHKTTKRVVAVKKINILAEDESTTEIIRNEVMLLQSLSHPDIIKLIAAYRSKKYALIVTEFQKGRDLQQKISELRRENRKLNEKQIYGIFGKMLRGVAFLHQKNIIHRDIKPSNIFIDGEDQLKIGDLGAAKIVEELNFTRIGTPYYLPPEIIRHENYTLSADIWSLGVTLYHLSYLQLPFKASNVIKLGQLIVQAEPVYPSGTCEWIERAIRSMLLKDEKKRPTAKQLLEKYFQSEVVLQTNNNDKSCKVVNLQVKQERPQMLQVRQEIKQKIETKVEENNHERSDHVTFKQTSLRKSFMENSENAESVLCDNYILRVPALVKRSTKTEHHRFLQRKFSHIGKETMDQNQSTIVLSVNQTESRHESLITPASPHKKAFFSNDLIPEPKHFKKSSCFKESVRPETHSTKNFIDYKNTDKGRLSFFGHRREKSAIQKKLKHSQLMHKIKSLKVESKWRKSQGGGEQGEGRPRIIVDSPSFVLLR